jgi:carbamoyltransferase
MSRKPISILGISAFYHDSAAALVIDGEVIAAAQEERFSRRKHDPGFPARAVDYCLAEAGLRAEDVSHVVFYEKPLLKLERLLETWLAFAPRGFRQFSLALPPWVSKKMQLSRVLDRELQHRYRGRYVYPSHHESHAASAFYPSPFEEAAILTMDGVGEWSTATLGLGRGNRITLLQEMRFPHSLGLLYSALTFFTGFKVNSGEYKLMGLAPYGAPRYLQLFQDKLMDLKPDGSFRLDMSYFGYASGTRMTSPKLDALLGGPPRAPEGELTQREMDIAASLQALTEEIVLRCARHLKALTGAKELVMAGGVALNCVANGRLLRDGPFERLWIQPAAGDAGAALGAALFCWHQLLGMPRAPAPRDSLKGSLLGPAYALAEIRAELDRAGAIYEVVDSEEALLERMVDLLAEGRVVAHLDGRMEFGPRALGNRSIFGDARAKDMQSVMNLKIKLRESFRPFAPVVLRERAAEWFELPEGVESPYMMLTAQVRMDKRVAQDPQALTGIDLLKQVRSQIPAVTHVDHSARLQTVDAERSPRLHRLLERFEARTGCPVLINTSFNVRGEPIVESPADAFRCFMSTGIDALVVGRCLLLKQAQPAWKPEEARRHLASFAAD